MGVEGEDKGYKGFLTGGIDFLRNVYLGLPTGMGKKVFVVGGGNTAIDCVRVALREGAEESVLVYRRSRKEMPADVWEVDGADDEGVRFEFQVLPTRVVANDNNEVVGVELIRMAMGEPDASGRRRPEPVPGSEFIIECDTIIPAIGQDADLSFIPAEAGIDTTKWSTIVTKYVPLKGADGKDLKDGMGNIALQDPDHRLRRRLRRRRRRDRPAYRRCLRRLRPPRRQGDRPLPGGAGDLAHRRRAHGRHPELPRGLRQERAGRLARLRGTRAPGRDPRQGEGELQELLRGGAGLCRQPGGARGRAMPALLPVAMVAVWAVTSSPDLN